MPEPRVITIDENAPPGAAHFSEEPPHNMVHDYNNKNVKYVAHADVVDGKAIVHLSAKNLGRTTGVSCSDMVNADTLKIKEVEHNLGDQILVGTVTKGNGKELKYANRETLISNGGVVSGHFISTKSGSTHDLEIPVAMESMEQRGAINKQSISRSQHWHEDALKYQKGESLNHDIRLVKNGSTKKILIPSASSTDSSAQTRFWNANRNRSGYFDDVYATESAKTVDVDGKEHVVVDSDHYDEMAKTLEDHLRQKSDLSVNDGFKITLDTGNKSANGHVVVKTELVRTPIIETMEDEFGDMNIEDGVITAFHVKEAAGEESPVTAQQAQNMTPEELLHNQIFGSGDEDEPEISSFPAEQKKIEIISFDSDNEHTFD